MIAASAPLWPTWEMVWLIAASYLALALVYLGLVLWERRVRARELRHARMVARITSHYAPDWAHERRHTMPDDDWALSNGTVEARNEERRAGTRGDLGLPAVSWDDGPPAPRFHNPTCPTCRGTGGGVWNDCPTCDGNGMVA